MRLLMAINGRKRQNWFSFRAPHTQHQGETDEKNASNGCHLPPARPQPASDRIKLYGRSRATRETSGVAVQFYDAAEREDENGFPRFPR